MVNAEARFKAANDACWLYMISDSKSVKGLLEWAYKHVWFDYYQDHAVSTIGKTLGYSPLSILPRVGYCKLNKWVDYHPITATFLAGSAIIGIVYALYKHIVS